MSESIQAAPSASTGTQRSTMTSVDSSTNAESSDDSAGFTALFASYSELEADVSKQQIDENLNALLSELLPQDALKDGNSLPQDDNVAMWQAFLLLDPVETAMPSIQSLGVLDSQSRVIPASQLFNQNYLQRTGMQNKDVGMTIPIGVSTNNISAQLAATNFIPEMNESVLLNMNEQFMPVQGTSSNLSQGLAAVGFGTATQAANTQTQMAPLNLGQNAWESNLGSRLQMLVGQNIQTAEIRLDPPELGVLDIKIKVTNDIATVNIASSHTHVRDALESAVPKLREMFEESGLSLGDVNVKQESFSQQQQSTKEDGTVLVEGAEVDFGDEPVSVITKNVSDSLLDTYA